MTQLTKRSSEMNLVERLKARRLNKDICLILDVSGSMNDEIEIGQRKIDALRDIVSSIVGNPMCICFSSLATLGTKRDIPEPHGGTVMSRAINLAKEQGFNSAIMITDGANASYDETLALQASEGFKLQIMYVGTGDPPEFLNKLASVAGQFCTKEDLKQPKELTAKLQLLLGAAPEEKGPICL